MAKMMTPDNEVWELVFMLADSLTAISQVVNKTEEAISSNPPQVGAATDLRIQLLEAREALLLATLRQIRGGCVRAHIDFSEMMEKIGGN
jgi:hypothetical protein